MVPRHSLLAGVVVLGLGCAGTLAGDVPVNVPGSPGPKLPPAGATAFMTDPPGAAFYPQYVPGPYRPYVPITATPAFQWGYFGARCQPSHYTHAGFHNDVSDWFLPRR